MTTTDSAFDVVRSALAAHGVTVTELEALAGGYCGFAARATTSLGALTVKIRTAPHPVVSVRVASTVLRLRGIPHGGLVLPPIRTAAGWVLALEWVEGRALADVDASRWTGAQARRFGTDLGTWLRRLHSVRLARRTWQPRAEHRFTAKLAQCEAQGLAGPALADRARRFWAARREALRTVPVALVHRDLQAGNVIVDGARFAAVIDFEQARLYDPVFDFVKLSDHVFPKHPAIGPATREAYGLDPAEPATRARLGVVSLLEYLGALVYFRKHAEPHLIERQHALLAMLLDQD